MPATPDAIFTMYFWKMFVQKVSRLKIQSSRISRVSPILVWKLQLTFELRWKIATQQNKGEQTCLTSVWMQFLSCWVCLKLHFFRETSFVFVFLDIKM